MFLRPYIYICISQSICILYILHVTKLVYYQFSSYLFLDLDYLYFSQTFLLTISNFIEYKTTWRLKIESHKALPSEIML